MRKLLCRLLGHPDSQRFTISMCDEEPLYEGCLRCGHEFTNKLKGTGDEE